MRDDMRFFDAIARRYDRVYALPSAESRIRMARILRELPERARVLDLGVGTGRELPALLDAGHAPTGLDFSAEMIALCKARTRTIPIVRADFWEPLPFDDASFEAVIALHGTLAHPPGDGSIEALAGEIARVLAMGGVLVVEAPAPAWLDALASSASTRRTGADRCVHEDESAHVAIEAVVLSPGRWRALLEPRFTVAVEAIGAHEMLIVARLVR
jgi:SAM-dependent methyltransferase